MRAVVPLSALTALVTACSAAVPSSFTPDIRSFTYVLQDYPRGRLDEVAAAPHDLAIIDLSRDGTAKGYFTAAEIAAVRASGKKVLAYFEIGSIEEFRTEFPGTKGLRLNVWADWPDERFVRYWAPAWWDRVVRPRVDQALKAGFDGVYLDTPLAYEEIDLSLVPGESRASLGRKMVDLTMRISAYAKKARPGFLIFPQNSPELRHHSGYTAAIDGIGMEELFFLATDKPCTAGWCAENLAETTALHRLGKTVLATDYAVRPANVRAACKQYAKAGFAGNVTVLDLDRISPPCGR